MNKNILYWGLYDFANSILFIVFIFYFSQWLVVDRGHPAWWFNVALIVSSLLFVISAPKASAVIDRTGKKLSGLRVWTGVSLSLFAVVALLALFSSGIDALIAALYTFGIYSYLMCFLYFTPMLNDLSGSENRARVSGIGQGFNFAGQVTGLLITLPFVNGMISLFGEGGRAETLVPAIIGMAVFAIPMLFLYREQPRETSTMERQTTTIGMLKSILRNKPLALVLLAFFFLSDASITFSNNFALYLEQVFGTDDSVKALLTLGILGLSIIGSVISGFIADRIGHRKTMLGILGVWLVIFCAIAFAPSFAVVTGLLLVAGIFFGPIWSVSRAMVGQLLSPREEASSYSYYVVAERFATFIGPLLWAGTLIVFGESAAGYQAALLAMAILILASLLVMRKVPETAGRS